MLQTLRGNNSKGFTLIELMIVIAIIGILAAIAIPNFIAYRNKAFCSAAEKDANSATGAIADYFAIPTRVNVPAYADLGLTPSGSGATLNTVVIPEAGDDPEAGITIVVTDTSGRCPADYQAANEGWNGSNVFTFEMD
jgi:type IV pilus assembly protein PilA